MGGWLCGWVWVWMGVVVSVCMYLHLDPCCLNIMYNYVKCSLNIFGLLQTRRNKCLLLLLQGYAAATRTC